jgi:hypothetical protein
MEEKVIGRGKERKEEKMYRMGFFYFDDSRKGRIKSFP